MTVKDLPKDEVILIGHDMLGLAMLMNNIVEDAHRKPIKPYDYYSVYDHKPSGRVIVEPMGRSVEDEQFNEMLKEKGQLN